MVSAAGSGIVVSNVAILTQNMHFLPHRTPATVLQEGRTIRRVWMEKSFGCCSPRGTTCWRCVHRLHGRTPLEQVCTRTYQRPRDTKPEKASCPSRLEDTARVSSGSHSYRTRSTNSNCLFFRIPAPPHFSWIHLAWLFALFAILSNLSKITYRRLCRPCGVMEPSNLVWSQILCLKRPEGELFLVPCRES